VLCRPLIFDRLSVDNVKQGVFMKYVKPLLLTAGLLVSSATFASDDVSAGRQLFEQKCAVCHGDTGGMEMQRRLAPPMMGVKRHYMKVHKDKESFVAAVVSWVKKPEEDKSLIKMAVKKFNLMPTIPVSSEDVEKIATYIYEEKMGMPKGSGGHMKKMHGGKGHKHGEGKGDHKGHGEGEGEGDHKGHGEGGCKGMKH